MSFFRIEFDSFYNVILDKNHTQYLKLIEIRGFSTFLSAQYNPNNEDKPNSLSKNTKRFWNNKLVVLTFLTMSFS